MIPNLKSKLKTMSSSSPLDKETRAYNQILFNIRTIPVWIMIFLIKSLWTALEYLVVNRKSADSDSGTDLKDSLCIKKNNFSMGNRKTETEP